MNKFTEEQIIAGARQMSDNSSEVCQVNREDNWQLYGQLFIDDFRSAADAAFSVSASTAFMPAVLTDERIEAIYQKGYDDFAGPRQFRHAANRVAYHKAGLREVAREVAAQAGQVASVPSAVAVPGWISVDESLPEFNVQVIGYSASRNLVATCYRYKSDASGWGSSVLYSDEITHWTPLPPSPAKESK